MATSSPEEIEAEIRAQLRAQKPPEIRAQGKAEAEAMAEYARGIAPIDTGAFKDSIHTEDRGDVDEMPAWVLVSDDEAANVIEYGSEDTPAHAVFARTAMQFEGDQQGAEASE